MQKKKEEAEGCVQWNPEKKKGEKKRSESESEKDKKKSLRKKTLCKLVSLDQEPINAKVMYIIGKEYI